MQYFKEMATETRSKDTGTGRERFRFSKESESKSLFDMTFFVNNVLYRFGLKVDDYSVAEEWLVEINGNKENIIYERLTDGDGKVRVLAPGLRSEKIKALATVGGPKNQSFLSTIIATLEVEDIDENIRDISNWFDYGLVVLTPNARVTSMAAYLLQDSGFRDFSSNFLRESSTGVEFIDVKRREITESEVQRIAPECNIDTIARDVSNSVSGMAVLRSESGNDILIQRKDNNDGISYFDTSVEAAHKLEDGEVFNLEMFNESDGTRRLLNLLPALYELKVRDVVYLIDEIDRSMHPIMVRRFLEYFLGSCELGRRQIVVSTHESNLLDLDLLRRDEIWFAEKDEGLTTKIYSLSEFKVRKDLEIRKHYLQGRFGAIPFLGDVSKLGL